MHRLRRLLNTWIETTVECELGIRGSQSRSRLTLANAKKFARTSDVEEHPDHQLRIHRGPTDLAAKRR